MAEPMKFNQYQRESKRKPLEIELPDGTTVTVPVPNGDQMMDAEESGNTRKALRLILGDKAWDEIRPLMKTIQDPEVLQDFVKDVMVYFGMAADDRPPVAGSR